MDFIDFTFVIQKKILTLVLKPQKYRQRKS